MQDDQVMIADNDTVGDDFDPDNPESYQDIDKNMEEVTGNVPQAGKSYSIADEVKKDDEAR